MTCPPEALNPLTLPELPVAVQVKVVPGSEANKAMLMGTLEQVVELSALVTDGRGLTVTL